MQKCLKGTPTPVLRKSLFEFGTVSVNIYKDVGVISGILVTVGDDCPQVDDEWDRATSPTVRAAGTCNKRANIDEDHADRNKEVDTRQGVR